LKFGGEVMLDGFDRNINYLRISVTDRCNFRCVYCMPPQGKKWLDHADILTYEELLRLITVFSGEGVNKIRLTGGEPLVRKGLTEFVAAIKSLGRIKDISLTTNGSLLPPLAAGLKAAGLDRVNISLDTVNPASFARLTTCGRLEDTMEGIESAMAAGLSPVKLNVVLTDALTPRDLAYFVELVYNHPIAVRFIEYMPIGGEGTSRGPDVEKVRRLLSEVGGAKLNPAGTVRGNGPAKYYQFPKAKGAFGFITPISDHFCSACNRLRLTADGKLRPCLLSKEEIDIKTPLRSGASDRELARLFHAAVAAKPEGHTLCRASGFPDFGRSMSQIGG
jgi:cyclic pyranopterin phosphate synthase